MPGFYRWGDATATAASIRRRCWYVRIVWPTCLVLLFWASVPRITNPFGLGYLIALDGFGIVAGLHGANQMRRAAEARREAEPGGDE